MEKSKKRGILLRVLSISAIAAITAGVIGAGTMARYSSQIGADGAEADGEGGTRGARVAAFHFVGEYEKDGSGFSDATGNISLFSSMYNSSTGRGTETDSDDVTVKSEQNVVAPGTNGAFAIRMSAGNDMSDSEKCYAETDTIVKLDIKQLESGVYADAAKGSKVPILYKVNNKYYVSKDSNLKKDHIYVFHNNGGVGGFTKDVSGNTVVTIDGYLEDLVNENAYYYKAKDKFYKLDSDATLTYTATDKNSIVDTNDGEAGIQNDGETDIQFSIDWIWNYQNLGDITSAYNTWKAGVEQGEDDSVAAFVATLNTDNAKVAAGLTQANAHANDAFDTRLGEAAFDKANGGSSTIGDIQLSVLVDATQVD